MHSVTGAAVVCVALALFLLLLLLLFISVCCCLFVDSSSPRVMTTHWTMAQSAA